MKKHITILKKKKSFCFEKFSTQNKRLFFLVLLKHNPYLV